MLPAMGLFFFFVGVLLGKAKQNYFIGIRTPWTLQDERVWNETHQRGALVFKISGVIALLGIIFPSLSIWFLLVPVLLATVYIVAYSYFVYRRLHKTVS